MMPIRYPTMIGILVGGISIAGCGADVPPAVVPTTPATSALPQLLAVASCSQVEGRVITLATGSEGIVDAFALVKRCTARPLQGEVALDGDAWVWVAVDRDLGAVRVRQFVHAALRAELRSAPERGHHWVALDALSLKEGELPVDLQLIASTDVYRRSLVPAAKQKLPALIELSADDAVWVRAVRAGADPALPTIVARARLPLDEVRNVDALVDIEGATGRLGRVRVRARVRDAP